MRSMGTRRVQANFAGWEYCSGGVQAREIKAPACWAFGPEHGCAAAVLDQACPSNAANFGPWHLPWKHSSSASLLWLPRPLPLSQGVRLCFQLCCSKRSQCKQGELTRPTVTVFAICRTCWRTVTLISLAHQWPNLWASHHGLRVCLKDAGKQEVRPGGWLHWTRSLREQDLGVACGKVPELNTCSLCMSVAQVSKGHAYWWGWWV